MKNNTFDKTYWDKNYSQPEIMDGICNAKEHAEYLRALLAIESVKIRSMVDLGFGYGYMMKAMLKALSPRRVEGTEPSDYAFQKLHKTKLKAKITLRKIGLVDWCLEKNKRVYDLGVCTSVLQYLSDKDLKIILPILSRRIKFLYLTIPTDTELKRQVGDLNFKDDYAIHRTREKYQKLLRPHFTFISSKFLESKYHFNEKNTPFTEHLFRY